MSTLKTGLCRPGIILYLATFVLLLSQTTNSAPLQESETTQIAEIDGGCYYNYQHYQEGARIITNEPCLNCTCHNRMLMCYLRVCPFTKAIGQDCTVEKRPDQCCPVITCPEVPVQLLTSTTSAPTKTDSKTDVGFPDTYGCNVKDKFFADGAQLPVDYNNPCELCYCIRNRTTCLMQQCTLTVVGCKPVYQPGICCPVKYNCDYDEEIDQTTPGLIMTTTLAPREEPPQCVHEGKLYEDGELIYTVEPCQHCYCLRGRITCAMQECEKPMEFHGKNCTALPPLDSYCCPTYHCEPDNITLETTDKFPGDDNSIPGEIIKESLPTTELPQTVSPIGNEIPESKPTTAIATESSPTEEQQIKTTEKSEIIPSDSTTTSTSLENEISKNVLESSTEFSSRIDESSLRDNSEIYSTELSNAADQSTESTESESTEKSLTESSIKEEEQTQVITSKASVTEKSSLDMTTQLNQENSSEYSSPDSLITTSESSLDSETKEPTIQISSMKTDKPISFSDESEVTTAVIAEVSEDQSTESQTLSSSYESSRIAEEESKTQETPAITPENSTPSLETETEKSVESPTTISIDNQKDEDAITIPSEVSSQTEPTREFTSTELTNTDDSDEVKMQTMIPEVPVETSSEKTISDVGEKLDEVITESNTKEETSSISSESVTMPNFSSEKQDDTESATTTRDDSVYEVTENQKIEEARVTTVSSLLPSNDQTRESLEIPAQGPSGIPIPGRTPEHKAEDKDAVMDEVTQSILPSSILMQEETGPTTYLPPPSLSNEIDRQSSTPLYEDLPKDESGLESTTPVVITPKVSFDKSSMETSTIQYGIDEIDIETTQKPSDEPAKDIATELPNTEEMEVTTRMNEIYVEQKDKESVTQLPEKESSTELITKTVETTSKETTSEQETETPKIIDTAYLELNITDSETRSPLESEETSKLTTEPESTFDTTGSSTELSNIEESSKPSENEAVADSTSTEKTITNEEEQSETKSPEKSEDSATVSSYTEIPTSIPVSEVESTQKTTDDGQLLNFSKSDDQISSTIEPSQSTESIEISSEDSLSSGIPGEGNCLVDGQSYTNNSAIPPANECQISCKCVSSIVNCELVQCAPPPENLSNCRPIYTDSNVCCPMYTCESSSAKPLKDNQIQEQQSQTTEKSASDEPTLESVTLKIEGDFSTSTELFKTSSDPTDENIKSLEGSDNRISDESAQKAEELSKDTPKKSETVSSPDEAKYQTDKTTINNDIKIQTEDSSLAYGESPKIESDNQISKKSDEQLETTVISVGADDQSTEKLTTELALSEESKPSISPIEMTTAVDESKETAPADENITYIPESSSEVVDNTEKEITSSTTIALQPEEQTTSTSLVEKIEIESTQKPLEIDSTPFAESSSTFEETTTSAFITQSDRDSFSQPTTEEKLDKTTMNEVSDEAMQIITTPSSSSSIPQETEIPLVSEEVTIKTLPTNILDSDEKLFETSSDKSSEAEVTTGFEELVTITDNIELSTSTPKEEKSKINDSLKTTKPPLDQEQETSSPPELNTSESVTNAEDKATTATAAEVSSSESPKLEESTTYTFEEASTAGVNDDQKDIPKDSLDTESTPIGPLTNVESEASQHFSNTPSQVSDSTELVDDTQKEISSTEGSLPETTSSELTSSQILEEKDISTTQEPLKESSSISSADEEQSIDTKQTIEPAQDPEEQKYDTLSTSPAPHRRPESPDEHISETDDPSDFPPDNGDITPSDPDDYSDDTSIFGPGTCRYGGKIYMSAQQIPRDDPCDFCFCFRSDIICLQQSCPPPITACTEQPIPGFCCPRYSCPVSMASSLNATTTTTTTTTQSPHVYTSTYKGNDTRGGCRVRNRTFLTGEHIKSMSGPCIDCICGGDGKMQCDPKACSASPTLKEMIAHAAARKRRRRSANK